MIYDCFIFFNELDLLEIRLHELAGVVDRFVLVEANVTHTHQPKPLYYTENRQRFQEFNDRIVPIVVLDMPATASAWEGEFFQRNCIARGLDGCKDTDTILFSDVDEIPRAAVVRPYDRLVVFQQTMSYYFLNFATGSPWLGTRALPFGLLRQLANVQAAKEQPSRLAVQHGGWHFSYTGGIENIRQKIQAFSHQEFNTPYFTNAQHIARAIATGADLFDRPFQMFAPVALETLPAYVIANRERFLPLLWSEPQDSRSIDQQCPTRNAAGRTGSFYGFKV